MVEISGLTFEDAFQQLEDTVTLLESGDLTLDEMLAKFEQGMALVMECRRRLDSAQARVTILAREVGELVDGSTEDDEEA